MVFVFCNKFMTIKKRERKDYYKAYREKNKEKRNKQNKEWCEKNKEYRKKYRKKHYKLHCNENKEAKKKYYKKWRANHKEKRNEQNREYLKNPEALKHHKARCIANKAIKKGLIKINTKCFKCLSTNNLEKHHPDYNKPLKVIFLCRKCHQELHNKLRIALER